MRTNIMLLSRKMQGSSPRSVPQGGWGWIAIGMLRVGGAGGCGDDL